MFDLGHVDGGREFVHAAHERGQLSGGLMTEPISVGTRSPSNSAAQLCSSVVNAPTYSRRCTSIRSLIPTASKNVTRPRRVSPV